MLDSTNENRQIASSNSLVARTRRFACWCVDAYDGTEQPSMRVSLTRAEVFSILSQRVKRFFFEKYYGTVTESAFQISAGHVWFANPHWPILYGRIDEESDGCKITTHFDISPLTKVFSALWLCFALAGVTIELMDWMLRGRTHNYLFTLSFPLLGIFIFRLSRLIGKIDEVKLLNLLQTIKTQSSGVETTKYPADSEGAK